jgi:multidrug efflux pump
MALLKVRDAEVYALVLPAVPELGISSGFDLELEDRGNLGHAGLVAAENKLVQLAGKDPAVLANVRINALQDTPQLHVHIDEPRANALGLSIGDINNTLSAAWGSVFINQFTDRGRIKQVYMQGDAPFRMKPDDLDRWYVRGQNGEMAPFSSFARSSWILGPAELDRYNGVPALEIQGQAAPGKSSGAAMNEMEKLIRQLPGDIGYDWTGLSYQERLSGSQAPSLYAISILVVFLCLAALYESWSIPFSVLLVIPLGVVGAVLAATMRGLYNDIYFQVGLLATIGLSAKNAILIVEFAAQGEREGRPIRDSALHAARLRLRPILMTSLAFVAGVSPLALSTGAGAASQNDIGTGVIGGMISATVLAIFFVPLFFLLVRSFVARRAARKPA